MLAGAGFDDGLHGEGAVGRVDSRQERAGRAQLVGIQHELLVSGDQTPLEPSRRMERKVDAAEQRRHERHGALVCRLSIRRLGSGQGAS